MRFRTVAAAALTLAASGPAFAEDPVEPPPPPPAPPEPVPPPPEVPKVVVDPPPPVAMKAPPPPVAKPKADITIYGFVQLHGIYDSTQGFNEQQQNGAIQRPGTYGGDHGETQLSARHSRIGLQIAHPVASGIKATAQMEMDFLGNQPANPPNLTESAFYQNGTFRFRHMYAKLETPIVDVIAGQWWTLFGWSSYFHPNSVEIMGLPGQAYKRTAQLRFAKTFKSPDVEVEVAVAAQRPVERSSATPDGVAGVKATFPRLRGWRTRGANDSSLGGAGIGVSGIARRFAADEFAAAPTAEVIRYGYGVSVDAMLPIIPATKASHANALTLTGSLASGAGIEDQYDGLTFGTSNPALPNPMMTNPAPTYTPNIDNGLALFAPNATGGFDLHPIQVTSYMIGLQYYLPPHGRAWLAANLTHTSSGNAHAFGNPQRVWDRATYAEVDLFGDITPLVRVGLLYSRNQQTFVGADADGKHDAVNNRISGTLLFLF